MQEKAAISIFLTLFILSIILIVSLGVALLMVGQIKMSGLVSESVKAFYASDAGAEQALYRSRQDSDFCKSGTCYIPGPSENDYTILDNGAKYQVEVKFIQEDKPHEITSMGYSEDVSRRVRLYSFP